MVTLGILASHRGSNARRVIDACRAGELDAVPGVVISNNARSRALAYAREVGVAARYIGGPAFADETRRDRAIVEVLTGHGVELLLLLGYMRLLGSETVATFRGRIINIHPALLPKYGGQGMFGSRVHQAVIAAGETETGISIHLVDEQYDHGQVLAQQKVPVVPGDTAESLAARVLAQEHEFLIATLRRIVAGEIRLDSAPEL